MGAGTFLNPLSPLLLRAICSHTHTAAHSPHKAAAQYADYECHEIRKLVPLPLKFNEYAKAPLDILGEEARMTPTKLLKYKTVVCTVLLKAFVVPSRSFSFIIFYLFKSNKLLLLYRARDSSKHSRRFAGLEACFLLITVRFFLFLVDKLRRKHPFEHANKNKTREDCCNVQVANVPT